MKLTTVIVPWKEGMLLCRAGNFARLASQFRSNILCRLDGKAAEANSIISLLILCAGLGATLEIEASGPRSRGPNWGYPMRFQEDSYFGSVDSKCEHYGKMVADSSDGDRLAGENPGSTD